jgi:hypothetical protein
MGSGTHGRNLPDDALGTAGRPRQFPFSISGAIRPSHNWHALHLARHPSPDWRVNPFLSRKPYTLCARTAAPSVLRSPSEPKVGEARHRVGQDEPDVPRKNELLDLARQYDRLAEKLTSQIRH